MDTLGKRKIVLVVLVMNFFQLTQGMEEGIKTQLSLIDLPPELHYLIITALIPDQLVSLDDIQPDKHIMNKHKIFDGLKEALVLHNANHYFEKAADDINLAKTVKQKIKANLKNLDLQKIVDESYAQAAMHNQKRARLFRGNNDTNSSSIEPIPPKYENVKDLKKALIADVVQGAFETAVHRNSPRIALILALTHELPKLGLDGVTLVDRYIDQLIRGSSSAKENLRQFIQILSKLQGQHFDVSSLFSDAQQKSLFNQLATRHVDLDDQEKQLLQGIM